ncbi:MAG TPA: thiamine-phosphate kinase [Acidimicrobiales bacterium]|nr:thiamine-phosphate kinase [Acidimicrobiales bacterium]
MARREDPADDHGTGARAARAVPGPAGRTRGDERGGAASSGGERAAIELLRRTLPAAPAGETWIGDDAAVLENPGTGSLLLATDCVVEGVHVDLRHSSLADVGWKSLAVNVSDLAAMAGTPVAAVVAVAGVHVDQLAPLYEGLLEAAGHYRCPVVGGDLSAGPVLTVSIAVLGSVGERPVLRSGARPGDALLVTGALGRSAAGLRLLRDGYTPGGRAAAPHSPDAGLVEAHRRPRALLEHGWAAARSGATAMIDCSDGLAIDLDRLASASGVGVELSAVPVAAGATLADALGGGEDYELVFAAPDPERVRAAFAAAGLAEPVAIGTCVADPWIRTLDGAPLAVTGFEHRM